MRKRDALRMVLRLPKVREPDKLFFTGLAIFFVSILSALILVQTGNLMWIFLLAVGWLFLLWFTKASQIMERWEFRKLIEEDKKRLREDETRGGG